MSDVLISDLKYSIDAYRYFLEYYIVTLTNRYHMKICLILLLACYGMNLSGQGTVLNTADAQQSYILFNDRNNTYLIDNCGGIINIWDVADRDLHLHVKFLPNGNIIYNEPIDYDVKHDIVERDWDGNEVSRIEEFSNDFFFYYEVVRKPNGNTLSVAREVLTLSELRALGYDVDNPDVNPRYMDMIVEVNPAGDIVWEWHIKDHVIQQRDSTAGNYGIVADHPELLDMDVPIQSFDWSFNETFMINSFDYNPELQQIAISLRKMGEIAIIDQSTTSAQAASSTGGLYGKGGDILWRWGNPANYGAGTSDDRYLYYQHNPNWIDRGPYRGYMTCYNNGLDRPNVTFNTRYSTVPVIDTKVLPDGSYELENGSYAPDGLLKEYSEPETNSMFYSSYTSGAEFMPNGNLHVTVGARGELLEFDPEGALVWKFEVDDNPYIYRSEKFSIDNPIFEGKDLSVKGQIFSLEECELYVSTIELGENMSIDYQIGFDKIYVMSEVPLYYQIHTSAGQSVANGRLETKQENIDIATYKTGMYFLTFTNEQKQQETVKFFKYN